MEKQENRLSIGKVNGVEIFAVELVDGSTIVPIRPICDALGVNVGAQLDKAKAHPLYSPTIRLSRTVGADGKDREMVCIELEYVFGWILSIHPDNVSKDAREILMHYQRECHHALFIHFMNKTRRQIESNRAEKTILGIIDRLTEEEKNIKTQLKEAKENLSKIRTDRLDDQPSLFD
ncbi:MAG: phage antirepressor N-terminal domain-containing protein [Muribaculaceae bacterium]|nr:phage antirepressor N-terminal domain-containing protein [Muribaculaceae bacterium]